MHHLPLPVAQNLDFDVARRRGEELLHVDRRVAEGALGIAADAGQRRLDLLRPVDDAHAVAAAAGRRLDRHRITERGGDSGDLRGVRQRLFRARHDRHARGLRRAPRLDLAPHRLDGLGWWSDEDDPGLGTAAGEPGVLGEEAVAGMDRLRPALPRDLQDALLVEIAPRRQRRAEMEGLVRGVDVRRAGIGVGVDGHRGDAHLPQGARDAHGDLPPVGDEHLAKQG